MLPEHFLEETKCERAKGIAFFKPHTLYANLMIVGFQFLKWVAIFHKPCKSFSPSICLVATQKIIINYDNHRQIQFSILLSLEFYRQTRGLWGVGDIFNKQLLKVTILLFWLFYWDLIFWACKGSGNICRNVEWKIGNRREQMSENVT